MSEPHVSWAKGGQAWILRVSDAAVTLRSTTSAPPGARIDGALAGEGALTLRVKIHACKRGDDGLFTLEGRPIDFTRDQRARAVALAGAAG